MRVYLLKISAILFIVLLIFTSCEEKDEISVEDQIRGFFSDLNSMNTTDTYERLSPNATDYPGAVSGTLWTTGVWSNNDFVIVGGSMPDSTSVTITIDYDSVTGVSWTFTMVDDDGVWLIRAIYDNTNSIQRLN